MAGKIFFPLKRLIKKNWPLVFSLLVFYLVLSVELMLSVSKNQGHLIYALDDAYIHMAMAKNIAQKGIWGVTRHGFTSSSSSLLWTGLLSLVYIFTGANEVVPFILNVLLATAIICSVFYFLKINKVPPVYNLIILLALIFITPLIPLVFIGMEHVLFIFLSINFLIQAALLLSTENLSEKDYYKILALASLLTITRYEGFFLIIAVCGLLLFRKDIKRAILLGIWSWILPVIYGLISWSKGWLFFPNSVLLKASSITLKEKVHQLLFKLFINNNLINYLLPLILLIVIGLAILAMMVKSGKKIWDLPNVMILIFCLSALFHLVFAQVGWFYRYESYLMGLGVFAISFALFEFSTKKVFTLSGKTKKLFILIPVIFVVAIPFMLRSVTSLMKTPKATNNIYEQQYQMGLFVKKFYQGSSVAINDIGAINYLADIDCVDLYGLANMEVIKAKLNGIYNTAKIETIAKSNKAAIALIYDKWLEPFGGVPSGWVKVGEWIILDNVVCGDNKVSFYSLRLDEEPKLIDNLKRFSNQLPKDVIQSGKYIGLNQLANQ